MTDRAWSSRLVRHPVRKRSGSILTTPEPARGQSHQVFFGRPLCLIPSTSHVIPYTTFDPVIIVFLFNMSKPSQPTLFDHQTGSNNKSPRSSSLSFPFRECHQTFLHTISWKHVSTIMNLETACFGAIGSNTEGFTSYHTQNTLDLTAIFPGEPGLAGCPLIFVLH